MKLERYRSSVGQGLDNGAPHARFGHMDIFRMYEVLMEPGGRHQVGVVTVTSAETGLGTLFEQLMLDRADHGKKMEAEHDRQ